MNPQTLWLPCGQGTVLHPVSGRQLTTDGVELKDFGRIFEVYHYGNEPIESQRLIVAAPALLNNLRAVTRELSHWHQHAIAHRDGYDCSAGFYETDGILKLAEQTLKDAS